MIEFGISSDRGDQIFVEIKPQRLASPDQTFDSETVQRCAFSINDDYVVTARLNFYVASGKRGQICRRAVRGPETHHQHLHCCGRVACNSEELRRARGFGPLPAIPETDLSGPDFYGLIDGSHSRILAFDFKHFGGQVFRRAKRGL